MSRALRTPPRWPMSSMPYSEALRVAATMAYDIERAHRFIAGMWHEAFEADERAIYAVTHCLEIISEASRRLPQGLKSGHDIPWERIVGAGSVYRYDDEEVMARIIWHTVHGHLGGLGDATPLEIDKSYGKNP